MPGTSSVITTCTRKFTRPSTLAHSPHAGAERTLDVPDAHGAVGVLDGAWLVCPVLAPGSRGPGTEVA